MQRKDRIRNLATLSQLRIGDWRVQPDRLVISQEGRDVDLEPRQMEVLVALAEHGGEVVSAEQLLIEVWRGTFYGDNPVHKVIAQLRKQLGDDSRAPRYIETIRKRGYRLIAPVAYPEDYRHNTSHQTTWSGRSPYVGLASFDDEHADMFFGRSRMTAELLAAMRSQIDSQRRFVLIVGASGCGKTSLLRAGAIPLLRQPGGFDGLQSLSVTTCDLSGVESNDLLPRLATSLGTWSYGEEDRPVLASHSYETVVESLKHAPETISSTISDAFVRHPSREVDGHPYAHLLLVIDHAEALVASPNISNEEREHFAHALDALCDNPRVLVVMITRSDFYPKLIEAIPELAERKAGDGHLDVLTPRQGEIAQIIRTPAMLAGLHFEEDKQSLSRLDDVLRDAAAQHPDALPLLQHTLQALYERRSESGELGFAAYRDIGGLEGALAHRAEEVFATLPASAQTQLDTVLAQLIMIQPDSDAVSARWVHWSALEHVDARALAEAFVRARLFVGELRDGRPGFGVAHEALLRQWPRARDWAQDNRRILHARARLRRAATRWHEEGRNNDHLLNAGRPLSEALEVSRKFPDELNADENAFLKASSRLHQRKRWLRNSAITALAVLATISTTLAIFSVRARDEAETRREEALKLSDFMLVDLADKLRPLGNLNLLDSISSEALTLLDQRSNEQLDTKDLINRSRALRTLGEVLMQQAKLDEAISAFEGAERTAKTAAERTPSSTDALAEYGVAAYWLGYYHYRQKNYIEAEKHWKSYLESSERLVLLEPTNMNWLVEESYALNNLGTLARDTSRVDEAVVYFQRSSELKKRAVAADPDNNALRYELIDTLSWISGIDEIRGNLVQASDGYAEQIVILRDLINGSPGARAWERRLATSLLRSTHLAIALGRVEQAQEMIDESIERLGRLTRQEPDNQDWLQDLAQSEMVAADLARHSNELLRADALLQEARRLSAMLIAVSGKQVGEHPDRQRLDAMVRARIALSKPVSPVTDAALDQAIADLDRLNTHAPDDINGLEVLSIYRIARGRRLQAVGRVAEARSEWEAVNAKLAKLAAHSRDIRIVPLWTQTGILLNQSSPALNAKANWLRSTGYNHPDHIAITGQSLQVTTP